MGSSQRKVVFVHRVTCDYSKTFLSQLHRRLADHGIDFYVVSGSPWEGESLVDVLSELPFGVRCRNQRFFGPLYWARGAMRAVRGADLVILEQLNGSLHLYPLLLRRWGSLLLRRLSGAHRKRVLAFYGHGATLNPRLGARWLGAWKAFVAQQVDWWFAYTRLSAALVEQTGFPAHRITVFENTIDITALRKVREALTEDQLYGLRVALYGEGRRRPTGVFCGRLVESKSIPFLLQCVERIHRAIPDFCVVVIGDGPDGDGVRAFCERNRWCAWVGRQTGTARVPYLALADVWLNPGVTGLAVVDAFAMGIPFVTTDHGKHSPEIAYLRDGENGLITDVRVEDFADAVVRLMRDDQRLAAMKGRSLEDGNRYTVENMVLRLEQGVLRSLEML